MARKTTSGSMSAPWGQGLTWGRWTRTQRWDLFYLWWNQRSGVATEEPQSQEGACPQGAWNDGASVLTAVRPRHVCLSLAPQHLRGAALEDPDTICYGLNCVLPQINVEALTPLRTEKRSIICVSHSRWYFVMAALAD